MPLSITLPTSHKAPACQQGLALLPTQHKLPTHKHVFKFRRSRPWCTYCQRPWCTYLLENNKHVDIGTINNTFHGRCWRHQTAINGAGWFEKFDTGLILMERFKVTLCLHYCVCSIFCMTFAACMRIQFWPKCVSCNEYVVHSPIYLHPYTPLNVAMLLAP